MCSSFPVIILLSHYEVVIRKFSYVQYQTYFFIFPCASGAGPLLSSQVEMQKQCFNWLNMLKNNMICSDNLFIIDCDKILFILQTFKRRVQIITKTKQSPNFDMSIRKFIKYCH